MDLLNKNLWNVFGPEISIAPFTLISMTEDGQGFQIQYLKASRVKYWIINVLSIQVKYQESSIAVFENLAYLQSLENKRK